MAGKNGGTRPGAGRPPGRKNNATLEKEVAREQFRYFVQAHAEAMHAAQIANAKGIQYLVGREKGSGKFVRLTEEQVNAVLSGADETYVALEVWQKDPSIQAYTDLMNRWMDKPKEQEQEHKIDAKLTIMVGKPW